MFVVILEQQSKRQRPNLFDQLGEVMAWQAAGMLMEARFENAKVAFGL